MGDQMRQRGCKSHGKKWIETSHTSQLFAESEGLSSDDIIDHLLDNTAA